MPDARAVKILLNAYWKKGEWCHNPPNEQDFEYACRAGVMFPPRTLDHDSSLDWALRAHARVSREQVAAGFLASLSTCRCDLRSALGSFCFGEMLFPHEAEGDFQCRLCGEFIRPFPASLSEQNVCRIKWAGGEFARPTYIALDLELFHREGELAPTSDDVFLFKQLLRACDALPRERWVSDLAPTLKGKFKFTKGQLHSTLSILGIAGILNPLPSLEFGGFAAFSGIVPGPSEPGSDGVRADRNAKAVSVANARRWFGPWIGTEPLLGDCGE